MPSDIQCHRQVPLNNAYILKETKLALHKLLKKFHSVICKSDDDIGQMYLIEMHIATRPGSVPVEAWPYPLALMHHDILKEEIKNLLDTGIICTIMSLWASHIVVVKEHTPEASPQQFRLCIDYRKLNSLLPSVTQQQVLQKALSLSCPYQK